MAFCQSAGTMDIPKGSLVQPNVCVDDEDRSTAVSYPHLFIGLSRSNLEKDSPWASVLNISSGVGRGYTCGEIT